MCQVNASQTTVRRRLLDKEMYGRVAVRKPHLRKEHRSKRLNWATDHLQWTPEQWSRVLWSDESNFQLYLTGKRVFVRRRPGERLLEDCVTPTVKHGGGHVMVWGCMCSQGVGILRRIDGNLRKEGYTDLLSTAMLPSAVALFPDGDFVFQQDNARVHTAHVVRDWFEDNDVAVMDWPAQSPDLSPIENLWEILFRKVQNKQPSNLDELWQILCTAWYSITEEELCRLVDSVPRRLRAVRTQKGFSTKY